MAAIPKTPGSVATLVAKATDALETLSTAVAREVETGGSDQVLDALKQCVGIVKQVGDAFGGPAEAAEEAPPEEAPVEEEPTEEAPPEPGGRTSYAGAARQLSQDVQKKAQPQP